MERQSVETTAAQTTGRTFGPGREVAGLEFERYFTKDLAGADPFDEIDWELRSAVIANERGDMMPKNAMIAKLQELGAPLPDIGAGPRTAEQPVGEGEVLCSRCGKVKPRMANPPFSSAQGKMIHEKVCGDCWREWIGMGTKVINEMRLPLADPQAQKIFDQHMYEFLNLK